MKQIPPELDRCPLPNCGHAAHVGRCPHRFIALRFGATHEQCSCPGPSDSASLAEQRRNATSPEEYNRLLDKTVALSDSAERPDEAHPLDEALGNLHAIAISLHMRGQLGDAMVLAKAHGQIQDYLLADEPPCPVSAQRVREIVDEIPLGRQKAIADLRAFVEWLAHKEGSMSDFPWVAKWWCWLTTRHRMTLRYANYNVDVSGYRCRCGLRWKDNDYCTDSAKETQ